MGKAMNSDQELLKPGLSDRRGVNRAHSMDRSED